MNTLTKLKIARLLFWVLRIIRGVFGLSSERVICMRKKVKWNLDLSEGIDLSIYLFGAFEPKTARALSGLLKPGAVVFDIGANIGAHALPLARALRDQGRVYAIEPTDWAFQKLRANLNLNPDLKSTLELRQMALSDSDGGVPDRFHSSWNLKKDGDHPIHGGVLHSLKHAERSTLDGLVQEIRLGRLDVVKLDVDGFEYRILKGGRETLKRFKPSIVLELTPYTLEEQGDSLSLLLDLLIEEGYELWSETGKHRLPMNSDALRARIPRKGGINAIAAPHSKIAVKAIF